MSEKLSNEINSSVTMTEEEYFNKVSAALNDPEKLAEITKLDVKFGTEEVKAEPVVEPTGEEPAEGGDKEIPEATEGKEQVEVKEQPFDKDAQQKPSEPAAPKNKSDEATTVVPSSGEAGTLRKQLDAVAKERDEWKHKFTSNAGRIAAYQKTIADLKNQLALTQGNGRQEKPADKDGAPVTKKESPTLKKLGEIDPTLAEFLKDYRAEIEEELKGEFEGGLKQTQKLVTDTKVNEFVFQEAQRLREAVTNLDEVIVSKEYSHFYNNVATPGIRALLDSEFADDAVEGLKLYAQWYDFSAPKPIQPETKAEAKPTDEEAAKVLEARDRRLKAKDVSSAQPVPKSDGQFDPEKYFEDTFNKKLKDLTPLRR